MPSKAQSDALSPLPLYFIYSPYLSLNYERNGQAVNIPSEASAPEWINLYNGGGTVKKVPEEEEAQEELTRGLIWRGSLFKPSLF